MWNDILKETSNLLWYNRLETKVYFIGIVFSDTWNGSIYCMLFIAYANILW